jgi:2-oxoisovalerate dehydrogenase E2 component (dihydrolipoyl transacylase)
MARYVFRLPDVGEGVAEAEIAAWRVSPGERVSEDQPLVEVMTDKATVEISSPVTGSVLKISGTPGDRIAVGSTLIEFDVAEAPDNADQSNSSPQAAAAPEAAPETAIRAASTRRETARAPASVSSQRDVHAEAGIPGLRRPVGEAPMAAPATRARAYELGIPLQFVRGTGPGGRITAADLESYVAQNDSRQEISPRQLPPRTATHKIPIIGLRRLIADRMQQAKRRIPHFSYVEELDMTELETLRKDLNETRTEQQPKLTLLPFFMLALVRLQTQFPTINSTYDDEAQVLCTHEGVHIGIATQTPRGLMVPVVRHAETFTLWELAREMLRVTTAARDNKATREELSGSTITLTSLGALGGVSATPVINWPEVAIVGPNKLIERPVVRDGQLAFRTMMNLSSSFDHRIIDGHEAAQFIQALRRLIERPGLLLVGNQ